MDALVMVFVTLEPAHVTIIGDWEIRMKMGIVQIGYVHLVKHGLHSLIRMVIVILISNALVKESVIVRKDNASALMGTKGNRVNEIVVQILVLAMEDVNILKTCHLEMSNSTMFITNSHKPSTTLNIFPGTKGIAVRVYAIQDIPSMTVPKDYVHKGMIL